jgi:hypothetical protein
MPTHTRTHARTHAPDGHAQLGFEAALDGNELPRERVTLLSNLVRWKPVQMHPVKGA